MAALIVSILAMRERTCAVIGGGIAGLACARRLKERGLHATVFDTGSKAPGGRASSRAVAMPNGPMAVDHAAQFFTATGEFADVVRGWEADGIVRRWDAGLGELDAATGSFAEYSDGVERWMGANSMGDLAAHLARGLDVRQDVWVSPDGGVTRCEDDGRWLIRSGGRELGRFDSVAIAHNGKCAERLSKGTGSGQIHRLLRARFAPSLAQTANDRLVLNSLYSLLVVLPTGQLPLPAALGGARVLHSAELSFCACLARKRPEAARALGPGEEAWLLISTAAFGAAHKAPQEALPKAVEQEVTALLLAALAAAARAPAALAPLRTRLQLWGAAVPLNVWRADGADAAPPCALDRALRIGACGDWLAAPSIQGAYESGVALADALAGAGGAGAVPRGRWVPVEALGADAGAAGYFVDPVGQQPQPQPAPRAAPRPERRAAPAAAGAPPRAYVSNLPADADKAALLAAARAACGAAQAGAVLRASVPRGADGAGSRGFGFVELASEAALLELLGAPTLTLGGRRLRVERAKGQPSRR